VLNNFNSKIKEAVAAKEKKKKRNEREVKHKDIVLCSGGG